VDSSWYFLRFLSPRSETAPFESPAVNRWLPVNQYIGGVEHAILHLLYSRFVVKVLRDMGRVSFPEPFERLFTQGMICKDGHKMSKSKGNVVAPDGLIRRYGADTVRLYTLFIGPPEKDADWNDRGVEGAYRFLTRYWKVVEEFMETRSVASPSGTPTYASEGSARDLRRRVHEITSQVLDDMDRLHLNTAVSGLMQLVNSIQEYHAAGGSMSSAEVAEALDLGTRLLAPLAPHTAEGAWARLGHADSIFRAPWPQVSNEALARNLVHIVVQVNGKVRGQIDVPIGATPEAIQAAAQADPRVAKALAGKTLVKAVQVPNRLVNLVAR
jgi:leucyl-tRNA synthetase